MNPGGVSGKRQSSMLYEGLKRTLTEMQRSWGSLL